MLLLTSERAWAHAMFMKSAHSADPNGITGSTRSHIVSRLHKATTYASDLYELLNNREVTGASETDVLEVRAYTASLTGAVEFEKQSWEACLRSYAEARIIYSALATASKSDTFKDLLSGTIDPSIRYGAYQMRIPRTASVPSLARKYFPRSDTALVASVEALDPEALEDQPAKAKATSADSEDVPRTITWRTRQVDLEDASIALALASVARASNKLSEAFATQPDAHPKEKAAAYDEVLIASQDTVDATKHAIDELLSEGIGQGDKRMQSLQITRTAVNYSMISWRIGRNRVLTGENDGAVLEAGIVSKPRRARKDGKEWPEKEEGNGRKLARLRERVVLYDATLQSLDTIKELPGVAADETFLAEIQGKFQYFQSLKYGCPLIFTGRQH